MKTSALSTCSSLTLVLLIACGDSTSPEADPPALPAVESMNFDIETFPSATPGLTDPARSSHVSHHGIAALTVAITNIVVAAHLLVPVAAWRAARLSVPTLENERWHWRFDTSVLAVAYSGDLAAFVADGDVAVEMRMSSSAGLSDFLWYTGRAPIGGTTGEWEFFDPEAPGAVVGRIDWSHPGTAVWTLAFSALTGANAGDQLTYAVDGTSRTMTYYDDSTGVSSEIHWDAVSRAGYLEAPNYNNGDRACWDGMLQDTTCP